MKTTYIKYTNKFNKFIDKYTTMDKTKSPLRKTFSSVLAIFLGLVIAGIFIIFNDNNPIDAYKNMVKGAFSSESWHTTVIYLCGYSMFGLAVAFSFKTGLFNIGGSGQMFLGGSVGIYTLLSMNSVSSGTFILALLISSLLGFVLAAIAGLLRAIFNVHEVVSTILLNWIAYYIVQQMFAVGTDFYSGVGGPSSIPLQTIGELPSFITDYGWLFALGISIATIGIIAFILKKTIFGFSLKVVGESTDVAKYSGISVRTKMVISLGISGFIAGLGGGILYLLQFQQVSSETTVPTYGFDGIVIALLAFNAPIGILASSLFYSVLKTGQFKLQFEMHMGEEVYQIIIGIIIYLAAISSIFMRLDIYSLFRNNYRLRKTSGYKESRIKNKELIKEAKIEYKNKLVSAKDTIQKNRKNITEVKNKFKEIAKSEKKTFKNHKSGDAIIKYDSKIKNIYDEMNKELAALGFFMKSDARTSHKAIVKEIKTNYKLAKSDVQDAYNAISDVYRNRVISSNDKYEKLASKMSVKEIAKTIKVKKQDLENKRNKLTDLAFKAEIDKLEKLENSLKKDRLKNLEKYNQDRLNEMIKWKDSKEKSTLEIKMEEV